MQNHELDGVFPYDNDTPIFIGQMIRDGLIRRGSADERLESGGAMIRAPKGRLVFGGAMFRKEGGRILVEVRDNALVTGTEIGPSDSHTTFFAASRIALSATTCEEEAEAFSNTTLDATVEMEGAVSDTTGIGGGRWR